MKFLNIALTLLFLLNLNTVSSEDNTQIPLCQTNIAENGEITTNCSCFSDDTIILQDTYIGYQNETIYLENSTTHWRLSDCYEAHLSGQTLLSLSNLHTLQLCNITKLHIDNMFLTQYGANLQTLEIVNSSLVTLGSSINIHAHKFKKLVLNNMYLGEAFSLLINSEENQTLELIALQNNQIEELGEINISSGQVRQFLLENNNISKIMTGAILHNSETTTIIGNTFENMSLFSLDVSSKNFTFTENTVKDLRQSTIQVHNASFIDITRNVFSYIRQYSFIDLRTISDEGSFSFTSNRFYNYEPGSLQFYPTIYNTHLEINHNEIYVQNCDCKTVNLIEKMTQGHNTTVPDFHQHRFMMYELLRESSACVNENGVKKSTMILCMEPEPKISTFSILAGISGLIVVISLTIFYVQRKHKCIKKIPTNVKIPIDYSINLGYMDDSENEEYVRK